MSKILVKSPVKNNKVLVKATVTSGGMDDSAVQYDLTGKPVFVMGGGRGATGKTAAQRYLARLGGAAGAAAGALGLGGGQKRTLGEAIGAGIGGGYQGADLGNRLGNFLSTGTQREVANLRESQKRLNDQRAAYRKLGLPIPAELGGEKSGRVRVSSDPYVGVRGGGDDEMDVTNAQAANTVLSTIKDAESGTKIEPESQQVAVTDNPLNTMSTPAALAALTPPVPDSTGALVRPLSAYSSQGIPNSSQSMYSNEAVQGLGLNTQQIDPMDNSILMNNPMASNMVPPVPDGFANQDRLHDQMSSAGGADLMDHDGEYAQGMDLEAAKDLMDRQKPDAFPHANWNKEPNPNRLQADKGASRMDAYGNFQDMANWDEQRDYDPFKGVSWKMLKAFRLLKMLTLYPRYIRKGLVLVE